MHTDTQTIHFKTLTELHQTIGITKPRHPLLSLYRFDTLPPVVVEQRTRLIADFYQLTFKKECPCKMLYGQTPFDFDEGVISCFAPRQVGIVDSDFAFAKSGWIINIHPDFLRGFALSQKIKGFGFFDYQISEALILSEEEQRTIENLFEQIEKEYLLPIDQFSQDVLIAAIDLLLTHFNRYYHRQFITRKLQNNELLSKVEQLLQQAFTHPEEQPAPTAAYLASQLNLSSKYLSDCLKQLTGQTTQQLIHDKLIERAMDLLSTTELSVAEIAYQLGFEYPQSFSKLFKTKTQKSPLAFRAGFN